MATLLAWCVRRNILLGAVVLLMLFIAGCGGGDSGSDISGGKTVHSITITFGTLPGGIWSKGTAINASGQIIGSADISGYGAPTSLSLSPRPIAALFKSLLPSAQGRIQLPLVFRLTSPLPKNNGTKHCDDKRDVFGCRDAAALQRCCGWVSSWRDSIRQAVLLGFSRLLPFKRRPWSKNTLPRFRRYLLQVQDVPGWCRSARTVVGLPIAVWRTADPNAWASGVAVA